MSLETALSEAISRLSDAKIDALGHALYHLQAMLDAGREWPDAHASACVVYKVPGDLLTLAYDAWNEPVDPMSYF